MNSSIAAGIPERLPARPFRSHRTLRVSSRHWVSTVAALALGLLAAFALLAYAWAPGLRFAALLAGGSGSEPIFLLPALNAAELLWTAAACGLILFACAVLPGHQLWKYWVGANAAVLGGSALYAFFNGSVGYDAGSFMNLLVRTSVITIAACAPFLTLISLVLPLTFAERMLMILSAIALQYVLAIIRIAAFALLLARFGSVPEANLYMFAGPLLDVLYFIAVYSVTASIAGKRLARAQEAWSWL